MVKKLYLIVVVGILVGLGCGLTGALPIVSDKPQTETALAWTFQTLTAAPGQTQAAQDTATAVSIQASQSAASATQTAEAAAIIATRTQQALVGMQTLTAAAGIRLTATAEEQLKATQQAGPVMEIVQKLVDSGVLLSAEGTFHALDDFNQSWAQLGWYQWWGTGYSPDNFAIAAHAEMTSASDKANWPDAGCGFVFAEQDNKNHNLAYLSMDGYVQIYGVRNGSWRYLANKRYGSLPTPSSEADIALVVYNKRIIFFVNGQQVVSVSDSRMGSGDLNLTLLSGTNKDFGTRCRMTGIGLFIFK